MTIYTPNNTCTPTSIMIKGCSYLDILNPDPKHITLEAVAAGLEEPRFCNQTTQVITVADHQLRCARIAVAYGMSFEAAVACLMHDVGESFLRDLPGPIKKLVKVDVGEKDLWSYAEVEHRLRVAICEALILDAALCRDVIHALSGPEVHDVDRAALHIEALMWLPGAEDWALGGDIDPRAWMVTATPENSCPWSEVVSILGDPSRILNFPAWDARVDRIAWMHREVISRLGLRQ